MKSLIFIAIALWLSASIGGAIYLVWYQNQPADDNLSYSALFPAESHIERDPSVPTLVFFAHPKCPCTQASLHELERLMADVNGKLRVYFVLTKPPGAPDDWTETGLRTGAEAMPNVRVVIDEDEREAKLFNARTSGLNLLYDQSGILRFNGGITAARGHEGDNAARRAIYAIVTEQNDNSAKTPVFGCPLRHKEECEGEMIENAQ